MWKNMPLLLYFNRLKYYIFFFFPWFGLVPNSSDVHCKQNVVASWYSFLTILSVQHIVFMIIICLPTGQTWQCAESIVDWQLLYQWKWITGERHSKEEPKKKKTNQEENGNKTNSKIYNIVATHCRLLHFVFAAFHFLTDCKNEIYWFFGSLKSKRREKTNSKQK